MQKFLHDSEKHYKSKRINESIYLKRVAALLKMFELFMIAMPFELQLLMCD